MVSEPNAKLRHSACREYAPPAALREQVLCFWTPSVDAAGGEYSHRGLIEAVRKPGSVERARLSLDKVHRAFERFPAQLLLRHV
jgi:hypothetical protein